MKFPTIFVALCLSAVAANASITHGDGAMVARRHHPASLVQRQATTPEKKGTRRRCRAREPTSSLTSAANSQTSSASSTTTKKPESTTTKAEAKPTKETTNNNSGGSGGGKTTSATGACGSARAESKPSKYSGPNGNIDFLNCGVEAGGWKPPNINMGNVVFKSLGEALGMPNSPFKACSRFIGMFEKYAAENGVPAIMVASFAMQESSCNPNTVGGGGEQGLMQITREKCGGAPGGNCRDPDFNIRTGVRYFANRVKANGGNLLRAAGEYNGWQEGLTVASATRARHSNCCRCQNNLDYLHQLFNGWMQGVSPYATDMKKYDNLAVCG